MIAGLNEAYTERGTGIAAVNISIGGGDYSSNCDSAEATMKTAIDNLRSVNIATVIASGNNSDAGAVSSPGCISTAETIGATNNSDQVANFSNSSPQVDFFAPGVGVLSSIPTNSYAYYDGTSMATPHVVGAIAVMRSALGTGLTVPQEENLLATTGKSVTDTAANPQITRQRINVLQAIGQETITLTNDGVRDLRNPIPYDHRFATAATHAYWSAVAVRPPASWRLDLGVYNDAGLTTSLASSGYGGNTVDFVAQDGNRRAAGTTYPLRAPVHRIRSLPDRVRGRRNAPRRRNQQHHHELAGDH